MSSGWYGGAQATISDIAEWLGLDFWEKDPTEHPKPHRKFLAWPPDVFAVTAMLLELSGAYRRAVSPHGDDASWLSQRDDWLRHVVGTGRRWTFAMTGKVPKPPKWETKPFPTWKYPRWDSGDRDSVRVERLVLALWTKIWVQRETPIHQMEYNDDVWPYVLRLFCIADAACEGIGRCDPEVKATPLAAAGLIWLNQQMNYAQSRADDLRQRHEHDDACHGVDWFSEYDKESMPATLCKRIHPSRAVVLPKLRTPQRGIALRSISLHLALVEGADVVPLWTMAPRVFWNRLDGVAREEPGTPSAHQRAHNLLIIPHPSNVCPTQFRALVPQVGEDGNVASLESRFGPSNKIFSYKPNDAHGIKARVEQLVSRAEELAGPVRGVVLPEAALSQSQFQELFDDWKPNIDFLISGIVRAPHKNRLARNYAIVRFFGDKPIECTQHKHHRWALDRQQIGTYGLGGQLSPNNIWWEGIHIPRRRLHVFSLTPSCFFSALICEDLARPDPIGDVLRAIGPNLIIALLQDGPQLKERWAGRFTVPLADDPGSAVLSVTSLGMSRLSRPGHSSTDRTNSTVALFREPNGSVKEIALPKGADAIVLTLTESDSTELSADGRKDETAGGALTLGGVLPINTADACYND